VTVCLVLPGLVKMLFGAGSVFTRSPLSLLNTTFLAAMFGLTYLIPVKCRGFFSRVFEASNRGQRL
jgi:hypothetical protein